MSSEMTPFDAYQVHMERRLGEMRQVIDVELNRLHGEAVKVNAQQNSRSIFLQLAAVQACVEEATEEALTEGKALVDEARRQRKNALDLWREATADKARLVLHAHAEALYALNWCIAPELLPGVTPAITDSYKNALAHADCAVDDFTNGVWRPKPRPAIGATIITHNVHIGGNMAGGVIQQAGDQARQEAGATSSDTAKTFNVNAHTAMNAKAYVARASKSPLANAVFLAGQALAHPGRSLFFEEATPDDDGNIPVLHVTVRGQVCSAMLSFGNLRTGKFVRSSSTASMSLRASTVSSKLKRES